ncbi:sodium:phosphate symporter [Lysobacteraceae bacterium NML120232]|nr:sodium:phosphate symporter [Xanthomonadaceae bacterium NML08-0793]PJK10676.1 sodium:phosphate symporter [Xanthomonadaceae bacterium NML120232]
MKLPAIKPATFKLLSIVLLLALLGLSFWYSPSWLQLCYGLALFLFGMQCIEEGLHNTAGGTLERLMARSTATPVRGMLFGIGATFLLQSSTLVSLLTMAFLSTGLITLAGGIAVLLGTNLGATSGIWLLALAGQSVSLSPAAIPMLIFGILASFFKGRGKAFGRILVGIALIFLGIDAIKGGFQAVGEMDLAALKMGGLLEVLMFCLAGLLLTIVLQSSHATLILTLAALAGGQITLMQSFAIAVGSNVGSSISTAFVGMLGSERSGQRLALAHLLFNCITALLSLILWWPLTRLVIYLGELAGMGDLLQLAFFHTLFNLMGLAVFWPWQKQLAEKLCQWLPSTASEALLADNKPLRPRYLNANMLRAGDTALQAVLQEVRYFGSVSLEVLARVLYIADDELRAEDAPKNPRLPPPPLPMDAQILYDYQIKPLYSALLDFSSKVDLQDEAQQALLGNAHMAAFQLVEVIKHGKHLQKNLQLNLQNPESPTYPDYLRLRRHLFKTLRQFRQMARLANDNPEWPEKLAAMEEHIARLEVFRGRVMVKLRNEELDGWQTSSLMNDSNYARRIGQGLMDILQIIRLTPPIEDTLESPEQAPAAFQT